MRNAVVLVPTMPTPNGSLHWGHMAGPYLKCDVQRRICDIQGIPCTLISTSDVWETHVSAKANKEGVSEEIIIDKFHSEIENAFDLMHIKFDKYINPFHSPYRERLHRMVQLSHARAMNDGDVFEKVEKIPMVAGGIPVLGGLIAGICPYCGVADFGGFHCEECLFEVSPTDVLMPTASVNRHDWASIEHVKATSIFFKKNSRGDFISKLDLVGASGFFRDVVERFYGAVDGIRLTHPGAFGIPVPQRSGSVYFSFSYLHELIALCLEEAGDLLPAGCQKNTFVTFGKDNAIPYFFNTLSQMSRDFVEDNGIRFVPNFFLNSSGEKLSTSYGNSTPVADALKSFDLPTGIIRLSLALHSPEAHDREFDVGRMRGYPEFFKDVASIVGTREPSPDQSFNGFDSVICREIFECMSPERMNLLKAATIIFNHFRFLVASRTQATDHETALLEAFMPDLFPMLKGLSGHA